MLRTYQCWSSWRIFLQTILQWRMSPSVAMRYGCGPQTPGLDRIVIRSVAKSKAFACSWVTVLLSGNEP